MIGRLSHMTNGTSPDFRYPISEVVIVGSMTSLLSLLTAIFNAITVYIFITSPLLRNFGDFFYLNLAVADFNVGILSMPPCIPLQLKGRWTAGMSFCLFWLVWDYLNTASSSYNMGIISLDRYLMVSRPLWYRKHQSHRLRTLMMLTPWLICLTFYPLSILLWQPLSGHQTIENEQCYVPFAYNVSYLFFSACIGFIIPLTFVAVVNVMIYVHIRKRTLKRVRITRVPSVTSESHMNTDRKASVSVRIRSQEDLSKQPVKGQVKKDGQGDVETTAAKTLQPPDTGGRSGSFWTIISGIRMFFKPLSMKRRLRRDLRLARSLFILVFVFALCWIPYQAFSLILSVCEGCIDNTIFEVSVWLLWANSTVNPMLYPLVHKRFRLSFWRKLRHFRAGHLRVGVKEQHQSVCTASTNATASEL